MHRWPFVLCSLGLVLTLLACSEPGRIADIGSSPAYDGPVAAGANQTDPTATPEEPTATPSPTRPTPTATLIPRRYATVTPYAAAEPTVPVRSGFTEQTTFDYYPVYGDSAESLRAYMESHGPGGAGAAHFDAITKWHMDIGYRGLKTDKGCAISDVGVRVTVVITMPRWDDMAQAPTALQQRWNIYQAALHVHEEEHRQIAVRHGRDLVAALSALPPANDCDQLHDDVDAAAKAIYKRLAQADAAYDERTKHGITQGTKFP